MGKALTFRDRVKIVVQSGNGGDGCVAFRREKYVPRGGPAGGDGGRGGHVFLKAGKDEASLLRLYYSPHQRAKHGGHGKGKQCDGKDAADLYIRVPCGTVVLDAETNEALGEVLADGDELLIAKGGRGGRGNCHFATSSHRAPRESTPGEPGEERTLVLELKSVADVGLVGYPNAGKSTLLSRISQARPKIAAYPFTTLHPVIGTVVFDDYRTLRVADIPGLIEGAHDGVGLGHNFLRHIERTAFLLFIVDMAGVDGRKPWDDYTHLREELRLYREELDRRPFCLLANKMDLPEARDNLTRFIRETGQTPLPISAAEGQGIEQVTQALHRHFFGG